jgi:hypothetical protein
VLNKALSIGPRQRFRIVAACPDIAFLILRAKVGPDGVIRYLQLDDTVWAYLCSEDQKRDIRARGDDPEALARQTNGQIGWLVFQRLVQHLSIGPRQRFRIVAACPILTTWHRPIKTPLRRFTPRVAVIYSWMTPSGPTFMQTNGQIGWLVFQRLVQHLSIGPRQRFRIVAACQIILTTWHRPIKTPLRRFTPRVAVIYSWMTPSGPISDPQSKGRPRRCHPAVDNGNPRRKTP